MKKVIGIVLMIIIGVQISLAQQDSVNYTDKNGLKQGFWEEKVGVLTLKGYYLHDKKEGAWVTYPPEAPPSLVESYLNGEKNGISMTFDQRRPFLASEKWYKNGLLEGRCRDFDRSGKVTVDATYRKGMLHGMKKIYYENGRPQEEANFIDNERNGMTKWYNEQGEMVAEYNYKKGVFDGVQKTYYPGKGIQSETTYLNNKLNGVYKEYNELGNVQLQGEYKDGLKEGDWKEYDNQGKLIKTTKYKDDVAK